MVHAKRPAPRGFQVVGALKLASGLTIGAAGFGIFRLLNKDVGAVVEQAVLRLHLDPENRVVRGALGLVARLDREHLKLIGEGALFYALLHLIEGVGLLLRRRWAGYLTVVTTGSLLPLEAYEIAHRLSWRRIAVLLANLAIVAYLVFKLVQERRAESEPVAAATARPGAGASGTPVSSGPST